jgi:hypothetical protein
LAEVGAAFRLAISISLVNSSDTLAARIANELLVPRKTQQARYRDVRLGSMIAPSPALAASCDAT